MGGLQSEPYRQLRGIVLCGGVQALLDVVEQLFGLLPFTRQLLLSLLPLRPLSLQGVFDSLIDQRGCILWTAGRMT